MAGVVGAALRGFGKALGKIGKKASKVSDKTVGNITMGAIGAGVVGGGEALKRKKKKSKAPMFRNKKEFEAKKNLNQAVKTCMDLKAEINIPLDQNQ